MLVIPSAERGDGWEIQRGYLPPERAYIAASQVLWLTQMDLPFARVEDTALEFNRTRRMKLVSVVMHTEKTEHAPHSLEWHPEYWTHIDELLALYEKTRHETGDSSGGFFGQIYAPGGQIGWHRDEAYRQHAGEADDSASVTLAGVGRLSVKDSDGRRHNFTLFPGDRFNIDNSAKAHLRPLHKVKNVGKTKRITFVD